MTYTVISKSEEIMSNGTNDCSLKTLVKNQEEKFHLIICVAVWRLSLDEILQ